MGIGVCDRKETVNETVCEKKLVCNIKRGTKCVFMCLLVCEGGERVYRMGGGV